MLKNKFSGFTIIEMAVVLVIIGILMGTIYKGSSSSIKSAQIHDAVSLIGDLSAGVKEFKARYHYLPGDMPTATTDIAGATANGNGDGAIDAGEVMLVSEQLFLAGFTKGGVGDSATSAPFQTKFGRAWLVSASLARSASSPCGTAIDNTAPSPNVQNVILLDNLSGDVALAIDNKLDNGIYNSGNVRGSSVYTASVACLGISP
jgi:prepilin-type N-terminal cleavage/methylation domain-containing protein